VLQIAGCEGEVEVQADGERVKVEPAHYVRLRRGLRPTLAALDLDRDDASDWVRYNRYRDLLRHIGNPRIMVALTEDGIAGEKGLFLASQTLARTLQRMGFFGACVSKADLKHITVGQDGLIRWTRRPQADYDLLGRLSAEEPVKLDDGTFSDRISVKAVFLKPGNPQPLLTATTVASGHGPTARDAVAAALVTLGTKLAAEMAPRMVREIMSQRPGPVRLSVVGKATRAQLAALHKALAKTPGVARVMPLSMPGSRLSLAVAGQLTSQQLAQRVRTAGRGFVEQVTVTDGVVHVRLKPLPPAGAAGKTKAGKRRYQGVRPPFGQNAKPHEPALPPRRRPGKPLPPPR